MNGDHPGQCATGVRTGRNFFQDKRSGKRGSGVLAWGCHVMLKGRVEIRESEVVVGGIERLMFGGRT